MLKDGYEISLYRQDLTYQVVKLLNYLWCGDTYVNLSYFKWKYDDNPCVEGSLGIVALYKGKVVGFRGYFATKWQIREKDYKIIILAPGDTCVHPDHRRKGLSVAMGNLAMKEYTSKYKVFLNFTASANSVPGYLKMGFIPLVDKTYLTRDYGLPGFIKRRILTVKKRTELCEKRIRLGEFNNIVVADRPRPEEMYAVTSSQKYYRHNITLLEDVNFFRWRFNNKRKKYVFYYHRKNNIITGYIVMNVSNDSMHGTILDYAENDSTALEKILRYVIKMKHFEFISIYNIYLNDTFLQILKSMRFKTDGLMQIKKRKVKKVFPLLVRPVKRNCVEDDWFIEGLDIRKIENWQIKKIGSDAA